MYIDPKTIRDENLQHIKESLVVCDTCFETGNLPKGISRDDFEVANFYNVVNPSESNYNVKS
jgi:hypothetical protein